MPDFISSDLDDLSSRRSQGGNQLAGIARMQADEAEHQGQADHPDDHEPAVIREPDEDE